MCSISALLSPIGLAPMDADSPWTRNRSTACMFSIPSEPARVRRALARIEGLLRSNGYSDKEMFAVKLALEEAIANAMKHGNRMNPAKNVSVYHRITPERCDLCVCDEGPGFDPSILADPRTTENQEALYGRGILLMRHYMDEVVFHYPGNRVTLSKVRG